MARSRPALVVKIGGSALDLEEKSSESILLPVAVHLSELVSEYNIVVVPGGGPSWDPCKVWNEKYAMKALRPRLYCELAQQVLRLNALQLRWLFGEQAEVVPPWKIEARLPMLFSRRRIAILYAAPRPVLDVHAIGAFSSDAVTLAIAEALSDYASGVRVVFLKDIQDIRRYHPELTPEKVTGILEARPRMPERRRKQYEAIRSLGGEENFVVKKVAAEDILSDSPAIYRVGLDGDDDHLIETSALEFLVNECQVVDQVLVGNVNSSAELRQALLEAEPPQGYGAFYRRGPSKEREIAYGYKLAVCIVDDDPDEIERCKKALASRFLVAGGVTLVRALTELQHMGREEPDILLVDLYFSNKAGALTPRLGDELLEARLRFRAAEAEYHQVLKKHGQHEEGFNVAADAVRDLTGVPFAFFTRKGITQNVALQAFQEHGAVALISKPDPHRERVSEIGLVAAMDEVFRAHADRLCEEVEKAVLRSGIVDGATCY